MNRIEEIKKRLKKNYYDRPGTMGEMNTIPSVDVQYLLSKLEQADSFYEELVKDSHVWAEKAASLLKQIREE